MDKKTIVVVGAGQGLGNHVAERFGKEGFRVVLMARGEQSLKAYAQEFAAKGIEAHTYAVDAARPETLIAALGQAKQQFGAPDVLIYNVGITAADDPAAMDNAELMRHYQVDVASAYDCVRQVATEEFAGKTALSSSPAADWLRIPQPGSSLFHLIRRHCAHWLTSCTTS